MSDITAAERQTSEETLYSCQLNQLQVEALASGFVPASVKAVMMDFLTWQEQEEAIAARPNQYPKPGARPEPKKRKKVA